MGKFKRTETSVNGTVPSKKKPALTLRKEGQWVGGVWVDPIIIKKSLEPLSPETKLKQRRACAMIMARTFGVRDWHRKVLTPDEISAIEEERGRS
jgi:hypothetical protein